MIEGQVKLPLTHPKATTGGNALKFYASVRLDIHKTSDVGVCDAHDIDEPNGPSCGVYVLDGLHEWFRPAVQRDRWF